MLLVTVMKSVL